MIAPLAEKAKWELCKNAVFSLEQSLKALSYKTAGVVQPLTSYPANH